VRDQLKVIGFAAAVCIVCSLLLACVSSLLAERQARNRTTDIRTRILQVFGQAVVDQKGRLTLSREALSEMYESRVSVIVLDADGVARHVKVETLSDEEISERNPATRRKRYYPLYVYAAPDSEERRYAMHVSGKGLWSTIKGYMALEPDLCHIAALAFYEQKETPGLGGEIEKPAFLERFRGKCVYGASGRRELRIVRPGMGRGGDSELDGITGATMTCRGLEKLLNEDFEVYNRYFEQERLRR
jgi:Na+-transporting NADH:ubiquinone oxidoreductase subunit C